MVLDGLALAVEGIVCGAQTGLQSPLRVTAEGRDGGAGHAGGEHGIGVGVGEGGVGRGRGALHEMRRHCSMRG